MSAHVRFVDPPTPTSPTSPSTSSSDQGSTIRSPDHKDLEAVRAIFDRISQAAAETKAAGEAFEQLGHTLQHLATHLTDQAGSVRPTTGSETNGAASGGDDVVEVVKGDERWEEMLDMCAAHRLGRHDRTLRSNHYYTVSAELLTIFCSNSLRLSAMIHLGHVLFSVALILSLCGVRAATTDQSCLNACSDYSQTLGWCYGVFGAQPWAQNYTYANKFMDCICNGTKSPDAIQAGNPREQLLADAGICESCNSTPWVVQRDLAKLLTGCAIQEDNGSAAIAQAYAPTSYETANSGEYQLGNGGLREIMVVSGLSMLLLAGAVSLL